MSAYEQNPRRERRWSEPGLDQRFDGWRLVRASAIRKERATNRTAARCLWDRTRIAAICFFSSWENPFSFFIRPPVVHPGIILSMLAHGVSLD